MIALEKLLEQGFEFRTSATYPRHVITVKYQFAALLEMTAEGRIRQFSSAGLLLETGEIALLVERQGRSAFVHKSKEVAAEPEKLESYQRFLRELRGALEQQ